MCPWRLSLWSVVGFIQAEYPTRWVDEYPWKTVAMRAFREQPQNWGHEPGRADCSRTSQDFPGLCRKFLFLSFWWASGRAFSSIHISLKSRGDSCHKCRLFVLTRGRSGDLGETSPSPVSYCPADCTPSGLCFPDNTFSLCQGHHCSVAFNLKQMA